MAVHPSIMFTSDSSVQPSLTFREFRYGLVARKCLKQSIMCTCSLTFPTSMSCFLHEMEQPVERCSGCHSNGLTGLGSFNICTWILVTVFAIPSITAKSEDVCHIVGQRTWRMPRGCTLYAFLPPRSTYTYARDLRFVLHPLCKSSPGLGQQKYYPFYEAFPWNVLTHLDLSRKPSDSLSLHERYLLVTP